MKPTTEFLTFLMREALGEAKQAAAMGEVPVGAVLAVADQVISRAHNLTETQKDPTAHAEQLVIRDAASKLGDWRLTNGILVVTLEPCTMCAGAIKLSRIPLVVFGAFDPRAGAVGSLYDLVADKRTGQAPRVITEVLSEESRELLRVFFERRRQSRAKSEE